MSRLSVVLAALALGFAAGPARAQTPEKYRLDTDRLQFDRVNFEGRIASEDQNRDEFAAYCDVLLRARQFTAAELASAGDRLVTFRDLVQREPSGKAYQFQLLTFDGRLKSARPFPAPKPLIEAGVPTIYECWLLTHRSNNPVCVLATELPAGLAPSAAYPDSKPVTVGGYFFKLLHYDTQIPDTAQPGGREVRRAPLLMARAVEVTPEPVVAQSGAAWRGVFLPGVLGLLGVLAVCAVGLTLYFRRGDRAVRAEIEARRSRNPFAPESSSKPV